MQQIDLLLPQTQCTQCDYPRCAEYAEALADGEAGINQCPPGGEVTIRALAALTEREELPLNPDNGVHEPKVVAWIEEAACIWCRLCIKACPVDSIIGAAKVMHTVIADECTGCKLCVPVCPTDCISLHPARALVDDQTPSLWPEFSAAQVEKARVRTQHKIERDLAREEMRQRARLDRQRDAMKKEIQAALARKRGAV